MNTQGILGEDSGNLRLVEICLDRQMIYIFVEDYICKDYLEVFRKFKFLSKKSQQVNGIDLFFTNWKNWCLNWHMDGIGPATEKYYR